MKIVHFLLLLSLTACAASREDAKTAHFHFQLGVSYIAKRNYSLALKELLLARKLDGNNPLIHNHLGLTYYFLKEYEHSVISLKNALSKKANYSEAHNNLGRVYIDIKQFNQARFHLFKAANDLTYPHKDKVWLNIGLSHFYEDQFGIAQKYFLKSISANRRNCLAYNYYGRSLVEKENFKRASKALDKAVYHCRGKEFDEPHYFGAIALFRMGLKGKAIARLQEARKLYPKGPYREKITSMLELMKITETK